MHLLIRININNSFTIYEDKIIYINSHDISYIYDEIHRNYDEVDILEYNYIR